MMDKVFALVLMMTLSCVAFSQARRVREPSCETEPPFHYLIVQNALSDDKRMSDRHREMIVFLDETAFSEENLRLLFVHLAMKYPFPKILDVTVETKWNRIPNPYACPGSGVAESEQPYSDDQFGYHWSLFMRRGKDEIFRYNPDVNNGHIETVTLAGKPF
jgi:hypothetical protein